MNERQTDLQIMIKSLNDLMKNILFFGAGAVLIYWLSDKIGIVAKILFAIFASIAIFDGVRVLFVVITDLITIPVMIFKPKGIDGNGTRVFYVIGATFFQLIDVGVLLVLTYLLLTKLFPGFLPSLVN